MYLFLLHDLKTTRTILQNKISAIAKSSEEFRTKQGTVKAIKIVYNNRNSVRAKVVIKI